MATKKVSKKPTKKIEKSSKEAAKTSKETAKTSKETAKTSKKATAKRGRKSKLDIVKENLEHIKKWASLGATEAQIAKSLGISRSAFCEYKKDFKELEDVIKNARMDLVIDLKGTLVERAKGFEYEEKKQYIKKDEVTGNKTQYTEITTKKALPDVAALNLCLKNWDKEWQNDPALYELKRQELELRKKMAKEKDEW